MTKYLYNDYIKTLSERFEAVLSTIQIGHNFEYGVEFEIVLCEILRAVLPTSYGICRGYVVDKDGNYAGDDIIIYEQIRFPTFGLRDKENFIRKEFIPIEAVYCYIEAKHTLNISGGIEDRQSLSKAMLQTSNVKELVAKRQEVPYSQITPYLNVGLGLNSTSPIGYPTIRNPIYTVVFANQVCDKKDGKILKTAYEVEQVATTTERDFTKNPPDLIILGKNNVVVPSMKEDSKGFLYVSPFWIPDYSEYANVNVPTIAFGLGLASIMWALDWIQLGTLPWREIVNHGLRLSKK